MTLLSSYWVNIPVKQVHLAASQNVSVARSLLETWVSVPKKYRKGRGWFLLLWSHTFSLDKQADSHYALPQLLIKLTSQLSFWEPHSHPSYCGISHTHPSPHMIKHTPRKRSTQYLGDSLFVTTIEHLFVAKTTDVHCKYVLTFNPLECTHKQKKGSNSETGLCGSSMPNWIDYQSVCVWRHYYIEKLDKTSQNQPGNFLAVRRQC